MAQVFRGPSPVSSLSIHHRLALSRAAHALHYGNRARFEFSMDLERCRGLCATLRLRLVVDTSLRILRGDRVRNLGIEVPEQVSEPDQSVSQSIPEIPRKPW